MDAAERVGLARAMRLLGLLTILWHVQIEFSVFVRLLPAGWGFAVAIALARVARLVPRSVGWWLAVSAALVVVHSAVLLEVGGLAEGSAGALALIAFALAFAMSAEGFRRLAAISGIRNFWQRVQLGSVGLLAICAYFAGVAQSLPLAGQQSSSDYFSLGLARVGAVSPPVLAVIALNVFVVFVYLDFWAAFRSLRKALAATTEIESAPRAAQPLDAADL